MFACDGSGGEAASATLAQPARPDSKPPTRQPSTEEEGGCRLRGGPGSERPPCGVLLGKAWREADSGAWKSGERAGRGRVGKGQASRGSRRPGPGGGRGRAGPWCGAAAWGEGEHWRPRPAVCPRAEFAAAPRPGYLWAVEKVALPLRRPPRLRSRAGRQQLAAGRLPARGLGVRPGACGSPALEGVETGGR